MFLVSKIDQLRRAGKGNAMGRSRFLVPKTITKRNFGLRESYKLIFSGSKVPDSTISWQNMSGKLRRTFDLHALFDFRQIFNLVKEFAKPNDKSQMSKISDF